MINFFVNRINGKNLSLKNHYYKHYKYKEYKWKSIILTNYSSSYIRKDFKLVCFLARNYLNIRYPLYQKSNLVELNYYSKCLKS